MEMKPNQIIKDINDVLLEKNIIDDLGDIVYLHESWMADYLSKKDLYIDNYSINRFNFNKPTKSTFLISFEYFQKDSYQVSRFSTKILDFPFFKTKMFLIFSSFFDLIPNSGNNKYEKIKLQNGNTVEMDYFLNDFDIE